MPTGRQSAPGGQLPWPPLAWSVTLFSKTFWYSGVSGACCARPHGFAGSNPVPAWPTIPGTGCFNHCPSRSGYFASSKARAAVPAAPSAAASTIVPSGLRQSMASSSLARPIEITQVRRRLALLRGHQQAVAAQEIDLTVDVDVHIVFGAHVLLPPDRLLGLRAAIVLDDDPRPRQRVIDGGHLVVHNVRIGLVEIDALLDDRLTVYVHRNAARLKGSRSPQAARLDKEGVVAPTAAFIDPAADRIAREQRVVR